MNVVCSTRYLARFFIPNSITLYRNTGLVSKCFKLSISFRKETCYQLHTLARRKLERIHKKKEDVVTRSQKALQSLRKKRLEGLSESTIPEDVQLGEKLANTRSIRKLLSIYSANKNIKLFSCSNQVIALKRIAEIFEKHRDKRDQLSKVLSHQKLVCELIDGVTDRCSQCTPKELLDVVVALARLQIKHYPIYEPIVKEIYGHGFDSCSAEEIGLLCWAFGITKDTEANKHMEEIGKLLSQRELVTFSDTDLSRIAWSFAEQGVPAGMLLKEICSELLSRDLSLCEPRTITHISLAFSRIHLLADRVMPALEEALYSVIETKKFPTEDLVCLTVSFLRCNNISVKMFRRVDQLLISRRDFEETVSSELLEELLSLLKDSSFHLAEIRKIIENVLFPDQLNSVFEVFFRPRRSWKAKIFQQAWFKVY